MASNDDAATKQQELNNARYWKGQYEKQLQSYRNRYNSNNGKLERIRKVKTTISGIKDSLEEKARAQKQHAENPDTYYDWNGDKQQSAYNMYFGTTPGEYTYYISTVDNLLDAIVDLETQYENDNLEMLGLIGKVSGWINSLAGKIEKLLN